MISSDEYFFESKRQHQKKPWENFFYRKFCNMQKAMQILGVFDCKQIFQVVEELEENHDMAGVLGKTIGVGCGGGSHF